MSTIDKSSLEYLVGIGRESKKHEVIDLNGIPFSYLANDLDPVMMPMPDVLKMRTLSGLVDFITANRDGLDLSTLVIHVESPTHVSLCGPLSHATEQRPVYVTSEPLLPDLRLEDYLDAERFNLQLQFGFVDTQGRKDLLAFIASIRQESSVETEDDGVTQRVTAKAGIARVAEVPAPNPIILRPYRTFPEIEQPECTFILRMKQGPLCGLWDGDGGAWRNTAMHSIKTYLRAALPEMAILA